MTSPKGIMRMKGLIPFVIVSFLLVLNFGPEWITPIPVFFLRASIGLICWYWVSRIWFVHTRTHQLPRDDRPARENALLIGAAFIIGLAWLGV